MNLNNISWPFVWTAWILLGVILELIALYSKAKGDTLSENVWAVFNNSMYGKFAAWMLTAFLVWLMIHFASKGRYA